jgi:hypothetical protein
MESVTLIVFPTTALLSVTLCIRKRDALNRLCIYNNTKEERLIYILR